MEIKSGSIWIDDKSGLDVVVKSIIAEAFEKTKVMYDVFDNSGNYLGYNSCTYDVFLDSKTPKACSYDEIFKNGCNKAEGYHKSMQEWLNDEAYEDGLKRGKDFNKDEQNLNYRMGLDDGYESGYKDAYEEMYCPNNGRERTLQEQAYDEGYDQAIDDLIEEGVIGDSDEDYFEGDYSEYGFGDVEDDEEEYCFSKELDKILNDAFTSNIDFDGNNKEEMVNHPKHYNSDLSGVECIEVARYRNFNVGSALKYLWRCGLKNGNSDIQDLEKAVWYLNDEIKSLKRGR